MKDKYHLRFKVEKHTHTHKYTDTYVYTLE